MENIVIIGSSGHAKVIIDIVEQQGRYKIAGLIDRNQKVGKETLGYKVLGKDEDLPQLIDSCSLKGSIVANGDNFIRSKVVDNLMKLDLELPFVSAIHPKSSIASGVLIGEGSVIMAGVAVNSSCSIGRFCILNTNSSLDHDSVMEDFSSIAPRVTTGGNCMIGAYTAISIGAVLIHGINVGEHTVVGAGATVLNNIESLKVAYGTPAKEVRNRNPGDKYLQRD